MDPREQLKTIVEILGRIDGFYDFYSNYFQFHKEENPFQSFRNWKEVHGGLSTEEKTIINIAEEGFEGVRQSRNSNGLNKLSGYDKYMSVNDSKIEEFSRDYNNCKTGKVAFEDAEVQHYKTYNEFFCIIGFDIRPIYSKYEDSLNPYINAALMELFDQAGMYSLGLRHLERVFRYTVAITNPFWNTPSAIYGCTDVLFEIQHLLSSEGLSDLSSAIPNLRRRFLELLYLYLSRSIHIIERSTHSADYLTNRANLVYGFAHDFHLIFLENLHSIVKPEIQFMSDKAFAWEIAEENDIGVMFEQEKKDSYKMYEHASLIPNNTGGLHDEEDATMGELNTRGMLRSIALGNKLFEKYKKGYYRLNNEQIERIMNYLKVHYPDKPVSRDWDFPLK